jgi:hypothetical protein
MAAVGDTWGNHTVGTYMSLLFMISRLFFYILDIDTRETSHFRPFSFDTVSFDINLSYSYILQKETKKLHLFLIPLPPHKT